jgi:hypothetical protein
VCTLCTRCAFVSRGGFDVPNGPCSAHSRYIGTYEDLPRHYTLRAQLQRDPSYSRQVLVPSKHTPAEACCAALHGQVRAHERARPLPPPRARTRHAARAKQPLQRKVAHNWYLPPRSQVTSARDAAAQRLPPQQPLNLVSAGTATQPLEGALRSSGGSLHARAACFSGLRPSSVLYTCIPCAGHT